MSIKKGDLVVFTFAKQEKVKVSDLLYTPPADVFKPIPFIRKTCARRVLDVDGTMVKVRFNSKDVWLTRNQYHTVY